MKRFIANLNGRIRSCYNGDAPYGRSLLVIDCLLLLCILLYVFPRAVRLLYPSQGLLWVINFVDDHGMYYAWALCWLFLGRLIISVFRVAGVRFSKLEKLVMLATFLVLFAYYLVDCSNRSTLYFWDSKVYYLQQLEMADAFSGRFTTGMYFILRSVYGNAYSYLINLFTFLPFWLTDRTPDAYIACCCFNIFLPVILLLGGLINRMAEWYGAGRLRHKSAYFCLSIPICALFPLLHSALFQGQPDVFGMVFALPVLLLTMQYRFERWEWLRLGALFVCVLGLVVTRRWYAYFAVGYLAAYGCITGIYAVLNRNWRAVLRMLLYAALCALAGVAALFPILKHFSEYDYAIHYAAYKAGGFLGELSSQLSYLGFGTVLLLGLGAVSGLLHKQTRKAILVQIAGLFLSVFLFTRIQNMGLHQSLLLAPYYSVLLLICIMAACSLKNPRLYRLCAVGLSVFSCCNLLRATLKNPPAPLRSTLFGNAPIRSENRSDIQDVYDVCHWLEDRCRNGDKCYMLPHGTPYNPDVFRCAFLPDLSMTELLEYGSSILGTHDFPTGLLLDAYVITCDPFCSSGLDAKYNDAFLNSPYMNRFVPVQTFAMSTGYTFYVYQRIVPAEKSEIDYYRSLFLAEDQQFPEHFSQVFNQLEDMCQK